jgi:hypothetical protein
MAKQSSDTANPYTPAPGPTQKIGDFLKAPGSSAKPPVAPSKSTGLPQNTRKGAKR